MEMNKKGLGAGFMVKMAIAILVLLVITGLVYKYILAPAEDIGNMGQCGNLPQMDSRCVESSDYCGDGDLQKEKAYGCPTKEGEGSFCCIEAGFL
jgi:hypothetical protein|tara:strand:+ start:518 stop:802 length:285 start_codon:yes stop_codon:yes gene_type:complete